MGNIYRVVDFVYRERWVSTFHGGTFGKGRFLAIIPSIFCGDFQNFKHFVAGGGKLHDIFVGISVSEKKVLLNFALFDVGGRFCLYF